MSESKQLVDLLHWRLWKHSVDHRLGCTAEGCLIPACVDPEIIMSQYAGPLKPTQHIWLCPLAPHSSGTIQFGHHRALSPGIHATFAKVLHHTLTPFSQRKDSDWDLVRIYRSRRRALVGPSEVRKHWAWKLCHGHVAQQPIVNQMLQSVPHPRVRTVEHRRCERQRSHDEAPVWLNWAPAGFRQALVVIGFEPFDYLQGLLSAYCICM